MKKHQKSILVSAVMAAFMATAMFLPGLIGAGELEPADTPGPTMHTLEEIFKAVTPLPTGFVLWEDNIRFAVCDADGVVLDRATGLMWAKDANLDGIKNWQAAVDYCDSLFLGGRTDWRLPTIEELKSLSEPYPSTHVPALPEGHPFVNVQSNYYWSSTTYEGDTTNAWLVGMDSGYVNNTSKGPNYYVWPVRGGN